MYLFGREPIKMNLHLRIVSYQLLIRPILHFKWIQLISVHVELVSKGCFLDNQSLKTHLCLVSVFVALRRMLRLFLCCCSEKWKCNLGYDCNLSNLSNKTWLCTSHISKNNKNNESFQLRNSHLKPRQRFMVFTVGFVISCSD